MESTATETQRRSAAEEPAGEQVGTPPGAQEKPPPLLGVVGAGSFPAPGSALLCANNEVCVKPHRGWTKKSSGYSVFS